MRRYCLLLCAGFLLAACVGCGKDYYPRQMLVHNATSGRIRLAMAGDPEKLIQSRKIDRHERFTMADGTEIDVWVIKARSSDEGALPVRARATVLLLHGLQASKAQLLGLGQVLADRGFDVILPDLRAHGESTGEYVTYGAWERIDAKTVVDELVAMKAVSPRIYAMGYSLGGSTALQYAAIECAVGADAKCLGVVAVAPFKDAISICRRNLPLLGEDDFNEALRRAGEMANFDPADASAVNAARVVPRPIMLLHGNLDTVVPVEHSKAIFAAAQEPKTLNTVSWAGHDSILWNTNLLAEQIEQLDRVAKTYHALPAGPARPEAPTTRPVTPIKPAGPPLTPGVPKTPEPVIPILPPGKTPEPVIPVPPGKTPEPVIPILPPKTPEPVIPVPPGKTPEPVIPILPPKTPEPVIPIPPPKTPEPVIPVPPPKTPVPVIPVPPAKTPAPPKPATQPTTRPATRPATTAPATAPAKPVPAPPAKTPPEPAPPIIPIPPEPGPRIPMPPPPEPPKALPAKSP